MNTPIRLRRLVPVALLAVALLHTACIEFDRQVLTYRVDTAADELRIFQDYHGIYGADQEEELTKQEIQQLRSVLETERTFFFANWIFEFNVPQMEEAVEELVEEDDSPRKRELRASARQAVKTLRENLTINNGPFYLDADGHLSGVQMVRIGNLSRVVAAVNDGVRAMMEYNLLIKELDAEDRKLIERALQKKRPYLQVKGNRLTFRHPMTVTVFRRDFAKSDTGEDNFRRLRAAGINVTHEDGEIRVNVGREKDRVTRVAMDTFEKPYRENVLRYTQQARLPVEPEYDVAKAAREFLEPGKK